MGKIVRVCQGGLSKDRTPFRLEEEIKRGIEGCHKDAAAAHLVILWESADVVLERVCHPSVTGPDVTAKDQTGCKNLCIACKLP